MKDEEILDYLTDRRFPELWDASFQKTLCAEILRREDEFVLRVLAMVDYRLEHAHSERGYDGRWSILIEDLGEELAPLSAASERERRTFLQVCDISLRRTRMLPFDNWKKQKYLALLGSEAVDLLIGLLARFPRNWNILESLGNFSDSRVSRILVEQLMLPTENTYVKCSLIKLVAQRREIGDRFAAIERCAADESEDVRIEALENLCALDLKRAATAIREGLHDASGRMRVRALQMLAKTKDREATTDVASCLDETVHPVDVRVYAARTLGILRPPAPPPELTAALKDSSPEVRGMTAWALGEIGDVRSADALIQLRDDNCELTAWSIGAAIEKLKRSQRRCESS